MRYYLCLLMVVLCVGCLHVNQVLTSSGSCRMGVDNCDVQPSPPGSWKD